MKMLRRINLIMAISILCVVIYYFLIDRNEFSWIIFILFLTLFIFLRGLEYVMDNQKKSGYSYIVVSFVMFLLVIKDYISNFS
ncbi:hypothetical protein [Virgibacillus litoralis]|uniref:DUF3953 domain-containing protein n=1 Tax=Virgibacillus litoralis TaxID=578221 RepID=A0ABS4HEM4_9BACI|nr:hypothetical protein [Virgibacillus litoralis]MBP1949370.1 hypothetical protein [Virgibacillus litoralis]